VPGVRAALSQAEPITSAHVIRQLSEALQAVAEGYGRVLHAGDCAESFFECSTGDVARKLEVLDALAATAPTAEPIVQLGRLGGQFAKPRSAPTERLQGWQLPVFRGHMVNAETPTPTARRPDPRRMLWAYEASRRVTQQVAEHRAHRHDGLSGPWTSHEALVLDYETALIRHDRRGAHLASTHMPWVGERTRQLDHAHVELLAEINNSVGCKLGPDVDADTVTALCDRLDPHRRPGRLVLIPRMGSSRIRDVLPALVRAVHRRGHRPVWLNDPMHGNTVRSTTGTKTRHLDQLMSEAHSFWQVLTDQGIRPGGLHLEVAADSVTECVSADVPETDLTRLNSTLCDPRLNPSQAAALVQDCLTDVPGCH
jgi:3-deoxy-7-phosphoheptulonate synthase